MAEMDYDEINANKLKCPKCSKKRSNIWIKKKPASTTKIVKAR